LQPKGLITAYGVSTFLAMAFANFGSFEVASRILLVNPVV
jgi:hypothetical protein